MGRLGSMTEFGFGWMSRVLAYPATALRAPAAFRGRGQWRVPPASPAR